MVLIFLINLIIQQIAIFIGVYVESAFTFISDKEVMKEYPSPDELDSLGYAFMEIQKVIRL